MLAFLASPYLTRADDDCERYRIEVRSEATPLSPDFSSFLIRVEREETPDSYLFGTFHSADPRVLGTWAWLQVLQAALRPRLMVVERDLLNEASVGSERVAAAGETRLKSLADNYPELYRRSVDGLEELGIARASIDGLSIIQAVALLEQSPARRGHRGPVLDAHLQVVARELGIPILALETRLSLERRAATALTSAQRRELLWAALCSTDLDAQSVELQTDAYAENDVAGLYRALGLATWVSDSAQAAMFNALVVQRNEAFWERLEDELDRGGLFLAVGNLHLFAGHGIAERLAAGATDTTPYRLSPMILDTLRLTLDTRDLEGLARWARRWLLEHEGKTLEASDFDGLSVEFRSERTLQRAFCPGRLCTVEATYEQDVGRILLTEATFSRLAAAGYNVAATHDGAPLPAMTKTPVSTGADATYPESVLVRELVRHGFAAAGARAGSKGEQSLTATTRSEFCERSYRLHRASVAQAQFLRERLSRDRPHVFPLDPACKPQ